jgi:ABC-type amino acid transport substrate-binding protein
MFSTRRVSVAIDRNNPPYALSDDNGLHGASIDIISDAFAARGIEVEFCPVEGLVAQTIRLAAGRVDAAADMTVTARRNAFYRFSDRYLIEELQLFGLKHGPAWPGWRTFRGTLGVKADSYAHEFLLSQHSGVPALPVDGSDRLLALLRAGEVQAIVLSRAAGAALLASAPDELTAHGAPFGAAPLALATLPDRGEVLEAFNAGLATTGGAASYAELIGVG